MQKTNHENSILPIAVIGLGCWYPGAKKPKEFWENILAERTQFRKMPDCRLPLNDYYNPDPTVPDKTYGKKAALIDGYEFDWAGKKIPKSTYESTDLVHWLALDIAAQALEDAGFNKESIPKEKTGVIVGNSVTGEFTRSNLLRLRWPYVGKIFKTLAASKGWSKEEIYLWEQEMETLYKSVFPPVTEDSLAGGLSNTIAGRIANFFDLHGGGYTVDGACSSSLLAIITAISSLNNFDLDLAIAGGVDISLDTFELIGFAKTNALTAKEMTVYDKAGSGFIPGEGSGFVILKRLDQAIQDGNKIYAVIKGWGIASDGKGGITAPSAKGQAFALKRAYQKADYKPEALDFIEGHGTGTAVGDKIELLGISETFKHFEVNTIKTCGMTSLKSIIGHTKAAAGVGAFIKAVIAVNQRVLPPTANCKNPHAVFENEEGQMLYPIREGKVKNPEQILRAGVSAMGFGGINSHITLESGDQPFAHLKPELPAEALLSSNQDSEILVFSANTLEALTNRLQEVIELAEGISLAEITDLAAKINLEADHNAHYRAAVSVSTPDEIPEKIELLIQKIKNKVETSINDPMQKIWFHEGQAELKIGFLFPGQGSQQLNMSKFLINRFNWAQELAEKYNQAFIELGFPNILEKIYLNVDQIKDKSELQNHLLELANTKIAQPAIILSSLLWEEYLKRLGISPAAVAGHSLGELSAFHAAGAFELKSLIELIATRSQAMASVQKTGQMLSLNCDLATAKNLISQLTNYAIIANINSPTQIIASGSKEGIEELIKLANKSEIINKLLPVSNAFHSELMQESSQLIQNSVLNFPEINPNAKPLLFSTMLGHELNLKNVVLKEYFVKQVISPVQFMPTIKSMSQVCNFFLEIGPKGVLSKLVNDISPNIQAIALEDKPGSFNSFNQALGYLFCFGQKINWSEVYQNRLVRPFVKVEDKKFIVNPLERPLSIKLPDDYSLNNNDIKNFESKYLSLKNSYVVTEKNTSSVNTSGTDNTNIGNLLIQIAAKRTGFNAESILLEHRILDDLNLDSIKSAELVAEATRELKLAGKIDPSNYANSTLQEIKEALENNLASVDQRVDEKIAVNDSWVRAFITEKIYSPLGKNELNNVALNPSILDKNKDFQNLGNNEHAIFFVPTVKFEATNFPLQTRVNLLQQIASFDTKNLKSLTILHTRSEIASFGASLHLEKPNLKIRVIDIPEATSEEKLNEILSTELSQNDIYLNTFYNDNLERFIEKTKVLTENNTPRKITLSKEDVVLVTGGAKGITAECVAEWAKNYNVKLALLGRTLNPQNTPSEEITPQQNEILETLEKLKENGITAKYFACDVTNQTELKNTIQQVNQELGQITCLVHGAGANKPRRAEQVSAEEALKEISPKVMGLINLLTIFQKSNLKLITALSSIIGVTGMPGNAWYAYSNALLKKLLKNFKETHPQTETQLIAYSVWQEVGMGVRLGSVENLAKIGISAIPKKEGIAYFNNLLVTDPGNLEVIVTARVGGLDTWQPIIPAKPAASRFLEETVSFEPCVELITRTQLSVEKDLYLVDHNFKDSYLFPTVFGLEAMAEAAAYLTGKNKLETPLEIRNIELERPIVVDPEKGLIIQIKAEKSQTSEVVKASISTEHSNFTLTHFSCEFDLTAIPKIDVATPPFTTVPLTIDPKTELYGSILFQGERFQRINEVYDLTEKDTLFTSEAKTDEENQNLAYAPAVATPFILGDPFFRDTMLQSIQLIVPKHICLPINIKNIVINKLNSKSNLKINSRLFEKNDESLLGNVSSYGNNNELEEAILDYKLNVIEIVDERPSIEEILSPGKNYERIVNTEIKKYCEILKVEQPIFAFKYIPKINSLKKEERHKFELELFQELINQITEKDSNSELTNSKLCWNDSGKPIIKDQNNNDSNFGISFSHKDDFLFGIIGQGEQGCDVETIIHKNKDIWVTILGPEKTNILEQVINKNSFSLDDAATSIWSAFESTKKVLGRNNFTLTINKISEKYIVFNVNNDLSILTFPIGLTRQPKRIIALIIELNQEEKKEKFLLQNENEQNENFILKKELGQQGQNVYVFRHSLSFKDVSGMSNSVRPSFYAFLMGKIRELPLKEISEDILNDLNSGKWGMVTNNSRIKILEPVSTLDIIEGRFWIDKVHGKFDSTMDMRFEWHKISKNRTKELVAYAHLSTTWVAIINETKVEVKPFPQYMKNFIFDLLPNYESTDNSKFNHESMSNIDITKKPLKNIAAQVIYQEKIITSLEESNLVGNIYFANYYSWQERIKDFFFKKKLPAYNKNYYFKVLFSSIDHLKEAMPFDEIIINLSVKEIYEKGLKLKFDFLKTNNNNELEKLAFGEQIIVLQSKLTPELLSIPQEIIDIFKNKTQPKLEFVIDNSAFKVNYSLNRSKVII